MQKQNQCRWGRCIIGFATVMILLPAAAWACAVCFEGDDALARGLNMSILFLMSMPFAIFGSIFGTVYIRTSAPRGVRIRVWPGYRRRVYSERSCCNACRACGVVRKPSDSGELGETRDVGLPGG